jgi:uncharacterized protein YjbJ (UPF0337 family)
MGEITDKIKGKAKQLEGRLTGNKARIAEGILDETRGNLKGVANKAKEVRRNISDMTKKTEITKGKAYEYQ